MGRDFFGQVNAYTLSVVFAKISLGSRRNAATVGLRRSHNEPGKLVSKPKLGILGNR
jgi:hypothetical protein